MMDGVKIERAENGFEVEMCDPEIKKANMKGDGPYRDPNKTYVFTSMSKLMAFLRKELPTALAPSDDEYGNGFDKAVKEEG